MEARRLLSNVCAVSFGQLHHLIQETQSLCVADQGVLTFRADELGSVMHQCVHGIQKSTGEGRLGRHLQCGGGHTEHLLTIEVSQNHRSRLTTFVTTHAHSRHTSGCELRSTTAYGI